MSIHLYIASGLGLLVPRLNSSSRVSLYPVLSMTMIKLPSAVSYRDLSLFAVRDTFVTLMRWSNRVCFFLSMCDVD